MFRHERRERYFLRLDFEGAPETEVSLKQFIQAERAAGFHPKSGDGIATGGFSGVGVRGRVVVEWSFDDGETWEIPTPELYLDLYGKNG